MMPLFLFIFEILQWLQHIHSITFFEVPLHHCWSAQWVKPGCRAKYRTRACKHQADALPTELHPILLSYAAPYWAMPHLNELRCTPLSYAPPYLSYAASCWATPHPDWVPLHHTELRRIFRAMLHPSWASLHPTEIYCTLTEMLHPDWGYATPFELRRTLLSYAAPFRAMPHHNWATPHPTELRCTLTEIAAP